MNIKHDKIVVGSSLKAVMFAYVNELPIFFSVPQKPFFFNKKAATLESTPPDKAITTLFVFIETIDLYFFFVSLPPQELFEV